jgi:WD40 repeat protein
LNGHTAPILGALIVRDECALSWSEDRTLRRWNLATGESDVLPGHEGSIRGSILLPDDRLVTWSVDRSIRIRSVYGHDRALAFHFDATPTVVVPERTGRFVVGDALGRIHFLEIDDASEAYASSSLTLGSD